MAESQEESLSDSVVAGSDVIFDLYCEPCSMEDVHMEATGYCQDCQEYLCDNCLRGHRKYKVSRYHNIYDKADMPKTNITRKSNDILTETCHRHRGKILEYFCKAHNQVCCAVCLNIDHSACKGKLYVPDVSDGVSTSSEYKELVTTLDRLAVLATDEQKKIDLHDTDNGTYRARAIASIETGRKELQQVLDRIMEDAVQNVSNLFEENDEKIKSASQNCQSVISDVKAISGKLYEKVSTGKWNRLFVEMKLTKHRIPTLEKEIRKAKERKISQYEFDLGKKVQEIEATLSDMCTLSVSKVAVVTTARYVRQINVKASEDTQDCNIIGMAVLPGDRLVVADYDNNAVKLIKQDVNKVTSRCHLSSEPYDVIATTADEVAVALCETRKIELFTVTDVLARSRTVDVVGPVFQGLCFDGDSFIVVYPYSRSVKRINMAGKLVTTVYTDTDSNPKFKSPRYVALGSNKDCIYVTDDEANSVTCMTLSGEIISVCKHRLLENVRGVTVDVSGNVYVCSKNTHTVHELSDAGEHVQVLLDQHRIKTRWPYAIAFGKEDNTLFISSRSTATEYRNYVQVFQIE